MVQFERSGDTGFFPQALGIITRSSAPRNRSSEFWGDLLGFGNVPWHSPPRKMFVAASATDPHDNCSQGGSQTQHRVDLVENLLITVLTRHSERRAIGCVGVNDAKK